MPPTHLRLAYGHQSWTTAVHLERALRQFVAVTSIGPGHSAASSANSGPLLWVESGVDWVPEPTSLEAASSAAYLIDTHRGFRWRAALARAFDLAFTAQRPATEQLRHDGMPAEWLPLAAPRELCGPGPDLSDRPFDVAFVGQAPAGSFRAALLAQLAARVRMVPVTGRLEPADMMDAYRSARVVLNMPIADDLNMRAFEGPGARAVLVTAPVPGQAEVLPEDSFVVVDGQRIDRWLAAVTAALGDPDAQARADAAHEHVLAHHTYDHRAAVVADRLDGLERRVIDPVARRAALAEAWARWGRADEIRRLGLPGWRGLTKRGEARSWAAAARGVRTWRRVVRATQRPARNSR